MTIFGKVALVTGAAQGLGKTICRLLIQKNCKVALVDISKDIGETTRFEFQSTWKEADTVFYQCDVSSYEEFNCVFQDVKTKFGQINYVINNASILNENDWSRMLDINVRGTSNGIKLGFQHMSKENGGIGGIIVNISSMAALHPEFHDFCPMYSATKAFILGYSRSLATPYHLNRHNVRVNTVCPNGMFTAMSRNFELKAIYTPTPKDLKAPQPVLLQTEDVAKPIINILEQNKQGSIIMVTVEKGEEFIKLKVESENKLL